MMRVLIQFFYHLSIPLMDLDSYLTHKMKISTFLSIFRKFLNLQWICPSKVCTCDFCNILKICFLTTFYFESSLKPSNNDLSLMLNSSTQANLTLEKNLIIFIFLSIIDQYTFYYIFCCFIVKY